MNLLKLKTLAQLRQFLDSTQALEFASLADTTACYAHIAQTVQRFSYASLCRADRSVVLRYLERTSGYSSAQVKRLVARVLDGQSLELRYVTPNTAYAKRFTDQDIALLAQIDQAFDTLSGAATTRVLWRQWHVYGDVRFERLSTISVSHLYNLRSSQRYERQRVHRSKTTSSPRCTQIGERRPPRPQGHAGHIRIDSVHQGDHDGIKGVYHINAVDIVTQWQVVVCTEYISHSYMRTVVELLIAQFPFKLRGIHADNGVEYINERMSELMESARIELTKSRPRRSTDNALVEGKNGAVVRKMFGFQHIARSKAGLINDFNREHFNPLNNLHRPSLFASLEDDPKKPGRTLRRYYAKDAQTPLEKLASLPKNLRHLKPGVSIKALVAQANQQSDLQAAQARNAAWRELAPKLYGKCA
ncbi:MAG: integrase [Rhodoferax sp.]|nr:integrase [Rhodoferax sp.]